MAAKTTSPNKRKTPAKAAARKASAKTASRKTAKKSPETAPISPVKRNAAGILLLLLALCVTAGYFGVDALLLNFLTVSLRGLFGYGWYLAAPALLWASGILLFHRGRPVRLRCAAVLTLPLLSGSILHLFLCKNTYTAGLGIFDALWKDAQLLRSGGAISGSIAVGFDAVFGTIVSVMIFLVLTMAALFAALRITPAQLVERAKEIAAERETDEYDDDDDGDEGFAFPAPQPGRKARRSAIDIPLDDEPHPAPAAKAPVKEPDPAAEALQPKKRELFSRRSSEVKTPAEVVSPAPAAAPAAPPEAPAEEKKPKRTKEEISKQEIAEATEAVTAEIDKELSEEESTYQYPPVTLLNENTASNFTEVGAELRNNARRLSQTLQSFGVDAQPGEVVHGPSVTRYEFTLDQGVKLSKITNLSDDIALALGASGVRIAPIPNKISVVGIEVPNRTVTPVMIRDVIESDTFVSHPSSVAFAIGKDIGGSHIVGNIAKLPHVLIAGTTGSGKSVCTNSLIVSLLYKSTPDEVRFIMVDPKMVELAPYNGIPHLLIPVVTDPKKAAGALQWAVFEMMKRYKLFSEHGVKDLAGFNALAESEAGKADNLKKMPTVVVVIDELADLMLVAAKEVEESICRVAQMGRAAGMHLVIATQRPSADVITGLMKANIPSRIAFAVASSLESRIILDTPGAEKLVGKGDMLYAPLGAGKPLRVQGCLISPDEIERVVDFCKQSGEAHYSDEVMAKIEETMKKDEKGGKSEKNAEADNAGGWDELLPAAVDVVFETGQASVSMLQRRLKLGYGRAGRLMDQMEEQGIVGPFEGSKPRQLLITKAQWQELQMKRNGEAEETPPEIDRFGTISDQFESHDALDE